MKISRKTLILAIKALEAMRAIDSCLNLHALKRYDDAIAELNYILKNYTHELDLKKEQKYEIPIISLFELQSFYKR